MQNKMNADTNFIPFLKINSKQITGLDVKCKMIKPLENNIGENLGALSVAMPF